MNLAKSSFARPPWQSPLAHSLHDFAAASKMSYVAKDEKEGVEAGYSAKSHKIRITLTSSKVKALEKVCNDLVNRAKDKDLRVKGPVRLPTKVLVHTTRKTVRTSPALSGAH